MENLRSKPDPYPTKQWADLGTQKVMPAIQLSVTCIVKMWLKCNGVLSCVKIVKSF